MTVIVLVERRLRFLESAGYLSKLSVDVFDFHAQRKLLSCQNSEADHTYVGHLSRTLYCKPVILLLPATRTILDGACRKEFWRKEPAVSHLSSFSYPEAGSHSIRALPLTADPVKAGTPAGSSAQP